MTKFGITISMLLLAAIVVMIVFGVIIADVLKLMKMWQESIWQELRSIRVNVSDTAEYTHNHIAPDIEIISNNFLHLLDESVGLPAICKKLDDLRIVAPELRGILNDLAINSKGHYNELQQLREEIYSKRYLLGLDAKFPPCYAPNGICTNPQMDCINCPKRGTGGTWSTNTSIKAKGEMFQEKFNNSKED